ncbi:MAG: TlpA family protein disulfide reductase [Acidobacteria bacterium]|nr:TlpA family protein disulfide reductase [Acidobacteriota bacterium]
MQLISPRALVKISRRNCRVLLLSIIAVHCFAFTLFLLGSRTEAKVKIGKLPKDSVANHTLRTFDGKQFTLAGLRGQVVVLDFFAVWCGHSKQHVPTLARFGDDERQRGLQIIGLAVQDSESTSERIAQFIKEFNLTYPVGVVQDPVFSDFVESRDVSVPQTLIYGRDGRLVAHFTGHDSKVDADLTATIKRELEKK